MTEREMARPATHGEDAGSRPGPGGGLGFLSKAACRAGAWNTGFGPYQAHCYTDIYPLYYTERLAAGKIPYLGHPVEYPVLIGAAMQAAAWVDEHRVLDR